MTVGAAEVTSVRAVILFSLLGGLVSLTGCLLLYLRKRPSKRLISYATPFAAGALLSAVFLDLLKDGLSESSVEQVLISTLIGILLFFFAERFLYWFHHNHGDADSNRDASVPLVMFGNGIHNALDGVAIAASFLISVPTGIITTFAVALHEVPHNAADFGLLLGKGVSKRGAWLFTILSNLSTVAVAAILFQLGTSDALPIGILLGLSSGFLLYIALSDIIPDIHEAASKKKFFDPQPLMFLLGVILVGVSIQLAHKYIDAGHQDHGGQKNCISYYNKDGTNVLWKDCHDSSHSQQEVEMACKRASKSTDDPLRGITYDEALCMDAL